MSVMIEHIKQLIVGAFLSVTAYLAPIEGEIKSLVMVFLLNFLFGYVAGILTRRESFDFKKAFRCIKEATVFFVLVCALYYIGEHKGNTEGALQCISFITYAVLYFYALNILKNCKQVLADDTEAYKVVSFIYYVLSVEFIKNIPYLSNYLAQPTVAEGDSNPNSN